MSALAGFPNRFVTAPPTTMQFFNLCKRHCAADWMTKISARMDCLARSQRPGGVHERRASDAGRKRKATGERLAEANNIRRRDLMVAGEPCSRSSKAGVNFIVNQHNLLLLSNRSPSVQKSFCGNSHTRANLYRLDEN